ncbi:bifunctional metallophosphatase/5'-nucleotidase [Helcococcus kunzii]|uniref:bifunctional metallophosphatase/5'-nucleotidase n=1 Tax=Helcococcus kunzii TaxID=40091 RepID=UPI0021A662E4|nr:bifunctional UDP-sugar hydrolase/5'-nucleotidase [Helcococcus kunzii]MCT1795833.1 bifunctional metallophosphatase/5'-nucleotidase [Helcococcus kunzii]MCT1989828.1 bifunctional metallophosphatase/5'-nucleotidase [Helcococcus kunzii]
MDNQLKVTLLCTSDIHGYYMTWDYSKDEYSKIGGLTRISTIVKKIREENPYTILIDNGDLIQGNSAESFLKRDKFPGIEAINAMGYEIYNMGNHEFNFGMPQLINIVGQFQGIPMMGNLYRKKNTMRFMNGIYYKNIQNIRIGFIALNTPLVRKFEAKRGNLKHFDVIDANFELSRLLEEVEDCDALIGLFHMGDINENSIENTGVDDLLRNVKNTENINAVFGGHMHQVKEGKINNTIFLEPGYHGEAISRVDLFFDKTKSNKLIDIKHSLIKVDENIESDKELENILKPYHEELRSYVNEHIGYSDTNLVYPDTIKGIPEVRIRQTPIADFFLDVMLDASGADVAAVHFDNPYPILTKGEIKRKHINNSYSYSGGEVSVYEITGQNLRDYMEWSVSVYNTFREGDINISFEPTRNEYKYSTLDIFGSIKYEVDITNQFGNRIENLRYEDDTNILPDDKIKLAINKYRMDLLISDQGPLKGQPLEPLWSSITALGQNGTIRKFAESYIAKQTDQTYKYHFINRWHINIDNSHETLRQKAIKLINEGDLLLYKNADGEIDITRSLNLFNKLEEYQIEKLSEKYQFDRNETLGEILENMYKK